mgnify:CR=1 FL=1
MAQQQIFHTFMVQQHEKLLGQMEVYQAFLQLLNDKQGQTEIADRQLYAAQAFMNSSHYDTAIFNYFNQTAQLPVFKSSYSNSKVLRYGENPHQSAQFHGDLDAIFDLLNGRELSYNNLVDVEASLLLVSEFEAPTFAIIKHTNSCGLASRATLLEAYNAAYACDPTSAFGGVLACNRTIDAETAHAMNALFFEVVTAPDYTAEALDILKQKKNRIIIKLKKAINNKTMFKSLLNGVLEQQMDWSAEQGKDFKCVTNATVNAEQISDLEFAIKAVKHLKSNGIAIVKNQQLIGMGCGQTSRVDALESAIKKSKHFGFTF